MYNECTYTAVVSVFLVAGCLLELKFAVYHRAPEDDLSLLQQASFVDISLTWYRDD